MRSNASRFLAVAFGGIASQVSLADSLDWVCRNAGLLTLHLSYTLHCLVPDEIRVVRRSRVVARRDFDARGR